MGVASEWSGSGDGLVASGSRDGAGRAKWRGWRRDPPGGGEDLVYLDIPLERRSQRRGSQERQQW